jgi:hypothetical protein
VESINKETRKPNQAHKTPIFLGINPWKNPWRENQSNDAFIKVKSGLP